MFYKKVITEHKKNFTQLIKIMLNQPGNFLNILIENTELTIIARSLALPVVKGLHCCKRNVAGCRPALRQPEYL